MPCLPTVFDAKHSHVHVSQISPPSRESPAPSSSSTQSQASPPNPAMARPLLLLPLVVALAAAAAFVPARAALGGGGGRGPMVGGWSAIQNVSDPHIQELGRWALGKAQEKQLAGVGLRFRSVVSGQQQVVSGMNYRLNVDAADPKGRAAPYVAAVYEQVWTSTRELTSFTKAPRAH